MACLLPSDISRLAFAGAREPALETLRQFQAKLPSAYTFFHGVHWSRQYKSDMKFGKLDLVVSAGNPLNETFLASGVAG